MSVPGFSTRPQFAESVAHLVRKRIFDGHYAAGDYVRLDQLATELGISVTPVREALLELRAEGLLAQQPHRGFAVLPVTRQDLADVADVQAFVGGDDPERPGAEGGAHLPPSRSRAAAEMAMSAPQAP